MADLLNKHKCNIYLNLYNWKTKTHIHLMSAPILLDLCKGWTGLSLSFTIQFLFIKYFVIFNLLVKILYLVAADVWLCINKSLQLLTQEFNEFKVQTSAHQHTHVVIKYISDIATNLQIVYPSTTSSNLISS